MSFILVPTWPNEHARGEVGSITDIQFLNYLSVPPTEISKSFSIPLLTLPSKVALWIAFPGTVGAVETPFGILSGKVANS